MNDLNHLVLIGRLTQDAELKFSQNGYAIANFSIAVNKSKKNGDQWEDIAYFFEVVLYGKAAENLKPYLVKGKQVAIDGELRQDRWESEGQKRSKVVIVANNIQLVGGNNNNSQESNVPQQNYQMQQNYQAQQGYQQPQQQNYQQPMPNYQQPQQRYQTPPQQQGLDMETIPF